MEVARVWMEWRSHRIMEMSLKKGVVGRVGG